MADAKTQEISSDVDLTSALHAFNARLLELLLKQLDGFFDGESLDTDMLMKVLGIESSEAILAQLSPEQKAHLTSCLIEKLKKYVEEYDLSDCDVDDLSPVASLLADSDMVRKYFETHPEAFALIMQEFLKDSGALEGVDISASVAAELTPSRISAFLKSHPEVADSLLSSAISKAISEVPPHVRVMIETAVFTKTSLEVALKAYPDLVERAWVNALTGSVAGGQNQLAGLILQNPGFRDVFAKALAGQAGTNIGELTKNAVESLVLSRLEDRKHGLGLKSMICRIVLWLMK